jgi:hypothetical protein
MTNIYPKDYFKLLNNKIDRATCFVLMPFDTKFKVLYETIRDTLQSQELNFICKRADDIHQPHIIDTILQGILRAEFIIADLTDRNSNVFYELGIAHCIKDIDKVIILTQNMDFVPFDLRQFRCIVYEQSDQGLTALQKELVDTFEAAAKNTFRLKVFENKITPFDKKLTGHDRNFYKIKIETPHIGYGAVKLQIHFTQIRIDKKPEQIQSQFLFINEDNLPQKIENIPWTVSIIQINDSKKEAIISLDQE